MNGIEATEWLLLDLRHHILQQSTQLRALEMRGLGLGALGIAFDFRRSKIIW